MVIRRVSYNRQQQETFNVDQNYTQQRDIRDDNTLKCLTDKNTSSTDNTVTDRTGVTCYHDCFTALASASSSSWSPVSYTDTHIDHVTDDARVVLKFGSAR